MSTIKCKCGCTVGCAWDGKRYFCTRCLFNRIDELEAIVEKLPKCWRLNDVGELVQDVPVYPSMDVWFPWSNDGFAGPHFTTVLAIDPDSDSCWLDLSSGKIGVSFSSVYATKAAAEQAKEGAAK